MHIFSWKEHTNDQTDKTRLGLKLKSNFIQRGVNDGGKSLRWKIKSLE